MTPVAIDLAEPGARTDPLDRQGPVPNFPSRGALPPSGVRTTFGREAASCRIRWGRALGSTRNLAFVR